MVVGSISRSIVLGLSWSLLVACSSDDGTDKELAATGGAASGGTSPSGGAATGGASAAAGAAGMASGGTAGFGGGECVPTGPDLAASGATLVATASQSEIRSFAVGGEALYWNDGAGPIYRLRPGSTTPELVASDVVASTLIVAGGYLYYVGVPPQALFRVNLATIPAAPELVVDHVSERILDADLTNVYFTFTGSPFGFFLLPQHEGGAAVVPILPDLTPGAIAVAGGYVYFTDYTTLNRARLVRGATPELVTTIPNLSDVAVGEDGVVYLAAGDRLIAREPGAAPADLGHVLAVGNPSYAGSEANANLKRLTVTSDRVFYREETGALAWVTKGGHACAVVARVPTASPRHSLDYALDGERVFVLEANQRLYALPRP